MSNTIHETRFCFVTERLFFKKTSNRPGRPNLLQFLPGVALGSLDTDRYTAIRGRIAAVNGSAVLFGRNVNLAVALLNVFDDVF